MGKGSKKNRLRDLPSRDVPSRDVPSRDVPSRDVPSRGVTAPSVVRPRPQRVTGPVHEVPTRAVPMAPAAPPTATPTPVLRPTPAPAPAVAPAPTPPRRLTLAAAAALVGAKKIKKKCCRSRPRCKGCPVVLMRAARLQESGLTGKDLQKAVKRARAA